MKKMNKKTMRRQFILLLMAAGLLVALPNVRADITDGLVAYWPLDDAGGTTAGEVINGLDGSLNGDPTWVAGKVGGALDVDGDGDFVSCGFDPLLMPEEEITLQAWVYVHVYDYYEAIAANIHDTGSSEGGYWLGTYAGGYFGWGVTTVDQTLDYLWTPAIYLENTWYHLVATYKSGEMRLWVNGSLTDGIDSTSMTGNLDYTEAPDEGFLIGRYQDDDELHESDAIIDEVAVWNRVLTADEVSQLWNDGNGMVVLKPHPVEPIEPVNNDASVSVEINLSWTSPAEFEALGYDLYFGTEPNALSLDYDWEKKIDNEVVNSWDPPDGVDSGDLANLTDYYWRVDVYEPNDSPGGTPILHDEGGIWHFKTQPESPVILSNPEDVVILAGGTAVFTVEHSNGTSYEWYKVGVSEPIDSGTTTSGETITLSLTSVSQSDEGEYYCEVFGIGSTPSAGAWLTIAKLISHWQFEENLNDSVNGNHGYSAGPDGVTYAAGKVGSFALSLNGADPNEVVLVDHDEKLNSNAFTVALWAKVEGGSGTWRSPLTSRSEPPTTGYNLYASTSDTWQFWTGANDGWYSTGSTAVVEGEWVFLVATYDARTLEKILYVNGVAAGQVTLSAAINLNPAPNLLKIGGGGGGDPVPGVIFNGLIDDVKIWNYAINPFGVAKLYTDVEGGTICVEPGSLLYDFDGSCVIDIGDIAELVVEIGWLACNFAPDCLDEHTYKLD